jgi:hypothetical protein
MIEVNYGSKYGDLADADLIAGTMRNGTATANSPFDFGKGNFGVFQEWSAGLCDLESLTAALEQYKP